MIAVVDYQIGNIRSVFKAFQHLETDVVVAQDWETIERAQGVVLPGVAAFGDAMAHLASLDLIAPLEEAVRQGKPFLGICVGLQVLFDESEEMGHHQGMGLLSGTVERFPESLPVPQIGWNQVFPVRNDPLLEGFSEGSWVYFAHSYHVKPAAPETILAQTTYSVTYPCLVRQQNVYGIQFHPEKSQKAGLCILENFARLVQDRLEGRE